MGNARRAVLAIGAGLLVALVVSPPSGRAIAAGRDGGGTVDELDFLSLVGNRGDAGSAGMRGARALSKDEKDQVRQVMKSDARFLRTCVEAESKRKLHLPSTLTVTFTIGEDGVTGSVSTTNDLNAETLNDCVTAAVSRWRFPRLDGGAVQIVHPFFHVDRYRPR